jgi:hypothetical protein
MGKVKMSSFFFFSFPKASKPTVGRHKSPVQCAKLTIHHHPVTFNFAIYHQLTLYYKRDHLCLPGWMETSEKTLKERRFEHA